MNARTLVAIFHNLDIRGLGRCAAVSRRWTILANKEVLWKQWGSKTAQHAEVDVQLQVARNRWLLLEETRRNLRYQRCSVSNVLPYLAVISIAIVVLIFPIFFALRLGNTVAWPWKAVCAPWWCMLGTSVGLLLSAPVSYLYARVQWKRLIDNPRERCRVFNDIAAINTYLGCAGYVFWEGCARMGFVGGGRDMWQCCEVHATWKIPEL